MSVVPGECYIFTNLPSIAYKGWGLVFIVSGENHQDPIFERCTLHSLSQSLPLWLVSLNRDRQIALPFHVFLSARFEQNMAGSQMCV